MIRIDDTRCVETLSRHSEPAAFCKSGDTVVFSTRDCYDNGVTSALRPLGDCGDLRVNPATGPLYVEGAKPGDVLKVEILDIKLRDWGVMRSSIASGAFHELFDRREARIFDLSRGKIEFDEKLSEPVDTMIGVIGTAAVGDGVPTVTPGPHGGNMDCRLIVAGATVYLPVNADGALLAMGDLHARMGDGEVFICGLETAGDVTVRVSVVQDSILPLPAVASRGKLLTVQAEKTLDEAAVTAAQRMHAFLAAALDKSNLDTGMLMSLFADLVICQIVNPLVGVRAEFPLDILQKYGYRLP